MVIFLKDLQDGCVNAIIITEHTTAEEIDNAITKAKENKYYCWEDLLEALPDDCVLYDKWSSQEVWY